jgi:hypothetical protein
MGRLDTVWTKWKWGSTLGVKTRRRAKRDVSPRRPQSLASILQRSKNPVDPAMFVLRAPAFEPHHPVPAEQGGP